MEIEKKITKKVEFGTLRTGDVFLYDGDVYMVVDEDFGLGDGSSYDGFAIDLKTGLHYGFYNDDIVGAKVTAKLIITD